MLTNIAPIKWGRGGPRRGATMSLVNRLWLDASGQVLGFTAFNPIETDTGERNEPISLRLKLLRPAGSARDPLAVSCSAAGSRAGRGQTCLTKTRLYRVA